MFWISDIITSNNLIRKYFVTPISTIFRSITIIDSKMQIGCFTILWKTFLLVFHQCIQWVKEDGFDSICVALFIQVTQNRIHKTLSFTRACTWSYNNTFVFCQCFPTLCLMLEWDKWSKRFPCFDGLVLTDLFKLIPDISVDCRPPSFIWRRLPTKCTLEDRFSQQWFSIKKFINCRTHWMTSWCPKRK